MSPFSLLSFDAKQTQSHLLVIARASLFKRWEKRGLGTKSTRASIIDTLLHQRKYLKNDPSYRQLGMAIADAISQFAPHITFAPDMTAELESDIIKRC